MSGLLARWPQPFGAPTLQVQHAGFVYLRSIDPGGCRSGFCWGTPPLMHVEWKGLGPVGCPMLHYDVYGAHSDRLPSFRTLWYRLGDPPHSAPPWRRADATLTWHPRTQERQGLAWLGVLPGGFPHTPCGPCGQLGLDRLQQVCW